ncbi:NAD-dependent succinate-semialdehyde dehydrogenase [Bordetella sp. 02P26C-1]|uniref:NAD-dependent succinate-semialdehyde dehydrogenase n=1 Tax=Bordetella sp. 02P26C-1 TaxID=2683195 RepID=UPI0013540F1D|nr:NAD-dependent succinate-semialdehyde dehydrogenase [Bordetella sp. 02P26C-1]MVW77587.1 aldehyde dehydrogenase family protein [Bordetella sp. 02P26C-1]
MIDTTYQNKLFINGEWRNAQREAAIDVLNPSDDSVLLQVANASAADAIAAVDAAAEAAEKWAATPPRQRSEILRKCFELMTRDAESLAQLISLENGKALKDARGEVAYAAEFFRWFAEEAVRINGDLSIAPSGSNRILVQYQPIGVAVLITPWNFPAAMATRKIAPALAAGCTCVLKPATATPLTAYAIAKIMVEAGVPAGVVNVITSSTTSEVVNAMLDDPRVRKLSFTGSTEVGRVLLRKAADQVIHCSMELGGNAPFIVFDDADLDKALDGVMIAKMRNGGEACTAANRIFVQRGIADEFSRRLTERMQALKVGPGVAEDTDCGPLVDAAAVKKVAELVDDAVSHGAKLLCGGKPMDQAGCYYPPTVLTDVPAGVAMEREEIFGPVAPLYVFDSEEEVIARANDTEYGLVAYVYTRDLTRGLRVSGKLEAGMLALNRGLVSDPAAPFGGVKQSGLGREGAHHGVLEFMEAKYIATDW